MNKPNNSHILPLFLGSAFLPPLLATAGLANFAGEGKASDGFWLVAFAIAIAIGGQKWLLHEQAKLLAVAVSEVRLHWMDRLVYLYAAAIPVWAMVVEIGMGMSHRESGQILVRSFIWPIRLLVLWLTS